MINSFRGGNFFLSNFFPLQKPIVYGWMVASTSEHLFQALKTLDYEKRVWILQAIRPGDAKRRGSAVVLRPDWDVIKLDVMRMCLFLKFTANQELMTLLIETFPKYLKEGNQHHDNYWGDCTCGKCADITGQNHLGLLLMNLRDFFMLIN